MPLDKETTAAADSGAVPVVREAQGDNYPAEIAPAIRRIRANTGWARRSSAEMH
jgi:hypothetical protein